MAEQKDPYHMTGEELRREADRQDEKRESFIADLIEAAVEIVIDIMDGAS